MLQLFFPSPLTGVFLPCKCWENKKLLLHLLIVHAILPWPFLSLFLFSLCVSVVSALALVHPVKLVHSSSSVHCKTVCSLVSCAIYSLFEFQLVLYLHVEKVAGCRVNFLSLSICVKKTFLCCQAWIGLCIQPLTILEYSCVHSTIRLNYELHLHLPNWHCERESLQLKDLASCLNRFFN